MKTILCAAVILLALEIMGMSRETLVILGVLWLLSICPLGIRLVYDTEGLAMSIILGFFRLRAYPLPKWLEKMLKKEKKKPTKESKPPEAPEKPKQQAPRQRRDFTDYLPFVWLACDLLGDFRKRLRMERLELKLTVGVDDPCDTALIYGQANAVLANLTSTLERAFNIIEKDTQVNCDFENAGCTVTAQMIVTISFGWLMILWPIYMYRVIKIIFSMKNKEANHE